MMTAFLIMLREGFEAALVVAIVFAYLRRIGRLDLAGPVWLGVGIAVALSIIAGVIIRQTIGDLVGPDRLRAFAAISILAVVVLTWMVFWMRRQARLIRSDLERRVDEALISENTKWAIAGVAFVAVIREGLEASLFLLAAGTEDSGTEVLIGGLLGLAVASGFAWLVYLGGKKLPMQVFFKVTGLILIVFAAGLCARSVMFLQAANDLGSFNLNGVYDLREYAWLTQNTEVGKFLAAMFGWDPRPSIEQVVVYLAYLIPVTWLFLREPRQPVETPQPVAEPASPVDSHA
jgi:high-affinity iron transporter